MLRLILQHQNLKQKLSPWSMVFVAMLNHCTLACWKTKSAELGIQILQKRNWWVAAGCRAEIEAKDNHTRKGLVELLLWIMPQYLCFFQKKRQYQGKIGHNDDDDRACCYLNQVESFAHRAHQTRRVWKKENDWRTRQATVFIPHYSADELNQYKYYSLAFKIHSS